VAGSCECGYEPSGSGATDLVSPFQFISYHKNFRAPLQVVVFSLPQKIA
jgi:hypothetical protein